MTAPAVTFVWRVEMDGRDITPWCRSAQWGQPDRFLEQEFEITTNAWHLFDDIARYNIFASYNPADPYAECVVRNGWVLPDRRRSVSIGKTAVPTVTIKGKSACSLAFRKTPAQTIVMVPDPIGDANVNRAREVLAAHAGDVGAWRVWGGIARVDQAVHNLLNAAGLRMSWSLPVYPMAPYIVPPTQSYWDAVLSLIEPWKPEVYFNEFDSTVWITDRVSRVYGRQQLTIRGDVLPIESISAVPVRGAAVRRCIVRVPTWR